MKIIFHNVNVILPNGVIFASGDKARIGKIHEAGRKAAVEKKRVNIYPEDANLFKGVAPGINQPIIVDGQVQMVLGVTGNPNEIARYAELAFLTAELLINQALTNEANNCKSSIRDMEFASLVLDPYADKNIDSKKEAELSAYLTLPKYLYLIAVEKTAAFHEVVFELIQGIKKLSNSSDLIVLKPNVFVVLNEGPRTFVQQQELISAAVADKNIHIRIGRFENIRKSIKSFRLMISLLRFGLKAISSTNVNSERDLISIKDLDDPSYLSSYVLEELNEQDLLNSIYSVFNSSSQGDKLIETVITFINEDQEVSRTADKLGIHRNTIQKRFDAVKQLSGLDPTKFKDLLLLYMAFFRQEFQGDGQTAFDPKF